MNSQLPGFLVECFVFTLNLGQTERNSEIFKRSASQYTIILASFHAAVVIVSALFSLTAKVNIAVLPLLLKCILLSCVQCIVLYLFIKQADRTQLDTVV